MNLATPEAIDVLVLDDHAIVRQGLALLIEQVEWVKRCRDAADLTAAIGLMQESPADVAIVDLSLKGASGLDAISALLARWPALRVAVLTMHADPLHHARASQRGALGFVAKDDASDELVEALAHVARGARYASRSLRSLPLGTAPDGALPVGIDTAVAGLTPRERQVLALIGRGHTVADVAATIGRSVKTVEAHRTNLREKLGLRTNQQLLQFSARWAQLDGMNL
jgi:DNA-binding NarL/FixJ family response regulator